MTWIGPVVVADSTAGAVQHFNPSITVDASGHDVHLVYYVQAANGQVWVESLRGKVRRDGVTFDSPTRLSPPFDLSPTNITISPKETTSYDYDASPCYGLGEYLGTTQADGGPVTAWSGDQ